MCACACVITLYCYYYVRFDQSIPYTYGVKVDGRNFEKKHLCDFDFEELIVGFN